MNGPMDVDDFFEVTRICEYLWHVVYHDIMKYGWENTPTQHKQHGPT